ncbi:MAG TPA: hypothetical protein VNO35_11250 [Steroidobacteraceae bacterium]|nr:hypothetical protein [Steroidobacteraceae bacterium]
MSIRSPIHGAQVVPAALTSEAKGAPSAEKEAKIAALSLRDGFSSVVGLMGVRQQVQAICWSGGDTRHSEGAIAPPI